MALEVAEMWKLGVSMAITSIAVYASLTLVSVVLMNVVAYSGIIDCSLLDLGWSRYIGVTRALGFILCEAIGIGILYLGVARNAECGRTTRTRRR